MTDLIKNRRVPPNLRAVWDYEECEGLPCYAKIVLPKHFFRIFQGFGVSTSHLKQLNPEWYVLFKYYSEAGETRPVLKEKWLTSVQSFWDRGRDWDNYGDTQKIMPCREMKRIFPPEEPPKKKAGQQPL